VTTYYVRKTGSDGLAGTSAATAWATIGKALTGGMASGDTVYVGAGVYREAVNITITPLAMTYVIGDVDGSRTGDAGEVRWTGYTSTDLVAGNATATCRLNGKSFLTFQAIHFVGSSQANGACIDGLTVTGSHDLTFLRCAFTPGSNASGGGGPIKLTGVVDTAFNYVFDACWFGPHGSAGGQILITAPTSTIADYNINVLIRNCVFCGASAEGGPMLQSSGANTFKGGGMLVSNCTLINALAKVGSNSVSVSYPMLVVGCYFNVIDGVNRAITASAIGQAVEDYNLFYTALTPPRTAANVTAGPFSLGTTATTDGPAMLWSYGQEVIWGGTPRPFGTPLSGSPQWGFGANLLAAGRTPTVVDDATVGSIAWTTPTNASVIDGTSAVATSIPATTGVSHYLKATNFSFAIPTAATIKSVRVELVASASAFVAIACSSVKLVKGGTIAGNEHASDTTTQFTSSLAMYAWGNTADPLWGNTLTPADVNASTFGCVWAAKNTSGSAATCNVDGIRVIVAYVMTDGSAVDAVGLARPAGGGTTNLAAGALERGNTGTLQSTTVHTGGGSAVQLAGPAVHDFYMNVDAGSLTVGIWARYSTAGQQPTVSIKANPAIGLNSDTSLTWTDPGVNTWGRFTAAVTPTARGVITLRCATAVGTGTAYFDDVTAT